MLERKEDKRRNTSFRFAKILHISCEIYTAHSIQSVAFIETMVNQLTACGSTKVIFERPRLENNGREKK